MRKVVLAISVLLVVSCGGGLRPDASFTKQKDYNANEDFLIALGTPLYLFSLQYQAKPLDYPEETWEKMSEEERLMLCLEYYTPSNVARILDRVNGFLAKAKAELPAPEYTKLIPQTNQMKAGDMPITKVSVERAPDPSSRPVDPVRALTIWYGNSGYAYVKIPISNELALVLEKLWDKQPEVQSWNPEEMSYSEWEAKLNQEFQWDRGKVTLYNKDITVVFPIETGYIEQVPALAEFEKAIQETDKLWKAFNNFNTYGANLKALKTDPENPIVRVMRTFRIREGLDEYIQNNVSPKNQKAFKSKAEAFMTAWGI